MLKNILNLNQLINTKTSLIGTNRTIKGKGGRMKSTIKWFLMILVLLVAIYGIISLISKGITSFKTGEVAGITFIVCIVIYFVARTIISVRKDSKDINDGN